MLSASGAAGPSAPSSTSAGTLVSIRAVLPRTGLKFPLASSRLSLGCASLPQSLPLAHIPPQRERAVVNPDRPRLPIPPASSSASTGSIRSARGGCTATRRVSYGRCIVYLDMFTRECLREAMASDESMIKMSCWRSPRPLCPNRAISNRSIRASAPFDGGCLLVGYAEMFLTCRKRWKAPRGIIGG